MVEYKYADLFLQDSSDKQLRIEFDTGTITNTELYSEQFELMESLCSEERLRFGSCEASSIKFRISNIVTSLNDKWLVVTETLDGNTDVPFQFGKYKVHSDKTASDRRYRDIVAYDAMYDIISANVADWYNTILPDADSTVTMKELRDSFMEYFGLEQEEVSLINDDMVIERTIAPSELSGRDVITAICELNACFGHIGRDGKFQYIMLQEYSAGLYPSKQLYPSRNLYPSSGNTKKIRKQLYSSCTYEDFETEKISKLQIRQTADDIGAIVGTGTNCYIIEDNFLVYGKAPEELTEIAQRIFEKISIVTYRPFNVSAIGNPTIEVGAAISVVTSEKIVSGYILQRTLKGIQALKDTYEAQGEQYQAEKVNSVQKSIIQLKGKTNELKRTVEETKLTISDLEQGLQSQITQNAESIALEVQKTELLAIDISANSDAIVAEKERAIGQEVELAAAISIASEQIKFKVSKGDISSEISQEAGKIEIKANRLSIDSDYFKLTEEGSITATGGTIGGFTIGEKSLYNGKPSLNSGASGVYIGEDGISVGYHLGRPAIIMNASGGVTVEGLSVNGAADIDGVNISNGKISMSISGSITCGHFTYAGSSIDLTNGVSISGNYIGFFGSTSWKQYVSTISAYQPTIDTAVEKINEVINALKAYGLL